MFSGQRLVDYRLPSQLTLPVRIMRLVARNVWIVYPPTELPARIPADQGSLGLGY